MWQQSCAAVSGRFASAADAGRTLSWEDRAPLPTALRAEAEALWPLRAETAAVVNHVGCVSFGHDRLKADRH